MTYKRGDELPEDLADPRSRPARLKEYRDSLYLEEKETKEAQLNKIDERAKKEEETGQKPEGRKPGSAEEAVDKEVKANVTDPESRIMKTRIEPIFGQIKAGRKIRSFMMRGIKLENTICNLFMQQALDVYFLKVNVTVLPFLTVTILSSSLKFMSAPSVTVALQPASLISTSINDVFLISLKEYFFQPVGS